MEKQLKSEKRRFGCYDDSAGIRYLIGSYYLIAGDLDNALRHYKWFKRAFPDDAGEPGQYISWTYALYKSGDEKKAYNKFLQTHMLNSYVIPKILDVDFILPFKWSNNMMSEEWSKYIPQEIYNLWKEDDIVWLRKCYEKEKTSEIFEEFYELNIQINNEPVGPKRSGLINKLYALKGVEVSIF